MSLGLLVALLCLISMVGVVMAVVLFVVLKQEQK